MERLFATISEAMDGAPAFALGGALAWGIVSVVLSPCHLASIPLIVGFIDEQGRTSPRRALLVSLLFSLGILASIAVIGGITAAAGRVMGDVGRFGNYFVALILFLAGLHLLDVIPLRLSGPGRIAARSRGLIAALALGLFYGVALGPCTFAYMAPVMGIAFKTAGRNALYGALLLAAYGIGHCLVIVLAGTFTGAVQLYLDWNERSRGSVVLKRVCGALVLAGGLYMIYIA